VKRRTIVAVTSVIALSLVAAACGGNDTSSSSDNGGGTVTKGGTIREELQTFGWTNGFDPTGEYLGTAWALYDQLLMRGLLTYNHRPAEEGGNVPIPDIATGPPTVSDDGLTYEFTLKTGVKWGPPLDRDVTSHDIEYAFERINTASLVAQYGNYYCGVITGMDCAAKKPEPIKGIETPDDTHITFHLDQPVGDFLYRLAMPATKAFPEEVAKCFTNAGDYGNYVMSSGPYMIYGQENLDITSCDTMKPLEGYDVQKGLTLVRNPNYDPSTDSTEVREANIDGLQQEINTNYNDIFQNLIDGKIDVAAGTPPKNVLAQFETNPDYEGWLHADSGDRTWYVTMNLFAAPFDDVHVRRAVNYALNKDGVRKAYGGTLRGDIATSIEPPTVLPDSTSIDPYGSAQTPQGNPEKAAEEMKQSRYDTNKNGICDDGGACDNILFLGRSEDPWPEMNAVAVDSLKGILPGLVLKEVDTTTGYTTLQQVKKLIPISLVPGWGKDYNSPYGFDYYIFSSDGIFSCTAATNYSLIGMTKEFAEGCGVGAEYDAYVENNGDVPNVDKQINDCVSKPADEVNACYAALDTELMTNVVPWVPWVWSTNWTSVNPSVTKYVYDGNANNISYVNSAVDNGLQPENVA
jgi:peptide/nickel transport system substrate-binding protein